MRKFFYLLFLLMVIIWVSCTNCGNTSIPKDTKEQVMNENAPPFTNEGMNNLQNSFEETFVTTSTGTFKKKKYPEYYGGSYIDEDQRTVVIILVGNSPQKYEKEFKERIGNWPVRFEEGKFSYNELRSIMDKFDEFIVNNKGKDFVHNIVGWGIYDDRNRFYIDIVDYSEPKIKEIKDNFMDSEAIVFEQSERPRDL